MTREPLTDQQQALVRDNARLVSYGVALCFRRGGRPPDPHMDVDDLRAVAAFALCKAARLYDPAHGKFSSYAIKAILRNLQRACNPGENRVFKAPVFISIESQAFGTDPDCLLSDVLASSEPGPEALAMFAETEAEYADVIRSLGQSKRAAMRSILSGETSGEYARRLGVCRQSGEQRRARARRTMRERVGP